MSHYPRQLLLLPLLALGCALRIPVASMDALPFANRADTLFLSPMSLDGGNVHLAARVEKSADAAAGRLRVWQDFLEQECRKQGLVLVPSRRNDSLAVARFRCPLEDGEWESLYGVTPGERSRVLVVGALRLKPIKRNFLLRGLEGLGLADDSHREYAWLELDYEVFDMGEEEGSGARLLVSREPDTPWVYNHTDRAGRLMMRGARDVGRLLGAGASQPRDDGEEQP